MDSDSVEETVFKTLTGGTTLNRCLCDTDSDSSDDTLPAIFRYVLKLLLSKSTLGRTVCVLEDSDIGELASGISVSRSIPSGIS